jgi:hypothetical protein
MPAGVEKIQTTQERQPRDTTHSRNGRRSSKFSRTWTNCGDPSLSVSSMTGPVAYPNFMAHATSKWGVAGSTQTVAAEPCAHRIRFNSLDRAVVARKITAYQGCPSGSPPDVFEGQ